MQRAPNLLSLPFPIAATPSILRAETLPVPTCFALSTSVVPASAGTISTAPPPNCSGGRYTPGTVVTLTANGAGFAKWHGDASGETITNQVAMTADRTVSGWYGPLSDVRPFTRSGASAPVVVTDVAGTLLAGILTAGRMNYFDFAIQNLGSNANPIPFFVDIYVDDARVFRYQYSSLGGNGTYSLFEDIVRGPFSAGVHHVRFVVDAENSLAETDETNNAYEADLTWAMGTACHTATAGVSPSVAGAVQISPASNCVGGYLAGTALTVTPSAVEGFVFDRWTVGALGTANPLTVVVSGNLDVTATFRPTCFSLALPVSPACAGTVQSSPAPNCAGTKYLPSTVVNLAPVPTGTYVFSS